MLCKHCNKLITGNSQYCSASCKTLYNRNKSRNTAAVTIPAVTSRNTSDLAPVTVPDVTAYNRQAVSWPGDRYESRPAPLSDTDKPHPGGRGKYTRLDGISYQFDCNGNAHTYNKTKPGGKPASYEDYIDPDGRVYVERANPLLINWGQHKTSSELKAAGLIANREPIPGDWDYEGSIDQGGG